MDVHLTKFIDDLMLRQDEPLVPSCAHTHAHTFSQDTPQPHTTALTLPLTLPETHSQQDRTAVAGQTQAGPEVAAASRGQITFLCKQVPTPWQASLDDTGRYIDFSLRPAGAVCNLYTVDE